MAYIDMELNVENMPTPVPLMKALRAIDSMLPGQILKVTTSAAESINNFETMCRTLGHKLLEVIDWNGEYTLLVQKH
jgi:TusA-related sulfurtransferase